MPAQACGRAEGLLLQVREKLAALVESATALAYLRACRRVGVRARALGRPLVRNPRNVEIGDDVVIDSRRARVELAPQRRGRLIIGHGVSIGPGSRLTATRYVEIGDRARVGAGCVVSDEGPGGAPGEDAGIWIGDAVTLGDGVTVVRGTVIGAGAVVTAGSVVSGSIPPGAVVNGGPRGPMSSASAGA